MRKFTKKRNTNANYINQINKNVTLVIIIIIIIIIILTFYLPIISKQKF